MVRNLFFLIHCFTCFSGSWNGVDLDMTSPAPLEHPSGTFFDPLSLQCDQSDLVNPCESEALSSSSVLSSSAQAPVRSALPDAVEVFYDNIARSRGSGIRSSCFSYDSNVLLQLINLHGLHCSRETSVDQMQFIILRHLVVGDCFRSAECNRSLPRGSRVHIVCSDLSSAFPSATDMSLAFLRRIVEDISTDQKLTNRKLSALAAAFTCASYSSEPFSAPMHAKQDALRLFMRVLKSESTCDDQSLLPADLEKMTKLELVAFARDHSIVFERRTTVHEL